MKRKKDVAAAAHPGCHWHRRPAILKPYLLPVAERLLRRKGAQPTEQKEGYSGRS